MTSISSNVRKEFLEQVFVFTPDSDEWPVSKKGKHNESNVSNDTNDNEAYDDEENDHNNTEDHDEDENSTSNEAQDEDDDDRSRENQYNDVISSSTASNGDDKDEQQQDDAKWDNCNDDDDELDDVDDDDDEVVVIENPQHSAGTTEKFGRLPPEQWQAMTSEERRAYLKKIRLIKLTTGGNNRQASTAGLSRTQKRERNRLRNIATLTREVDELCPSSLL